MASRPYTPRWCAKPTIEKLNFGPGMRFSTAWAFFLPGNPAGVTLWAGQEAPPTDLAVIDEYSVGDNDLPENMAVFKGIVAGWSISGDRGVGC